MIKEGKNQLNDDELEKIAGGGLKEQLIAGIVGISALANPVSATSVETKGNSGLLQITSNTNTIALEKQNYLSVAKYLIKENISKAQEKAFRTTNSFVTKYYTSHVFVSKILSSNRYNNDKNKTDLENQLDEDVKNGDLPLPNFTVEDIKNARNNVILKDKNNVEFVMCPIDDAITLHESEHCQSGDIVNLASQFNALESVHNEPTSVKYWYLDKTQGPYCALQSIAATKHREAAHLQGKLTDGLKEVLECCEIDGKPITAKYPNLYKGGYLEMMEITSEKDMKHFLEFLENEDNLEKHMKVLMQWVKCEGTEKKQLQFFTAAPSFQGYSKKIWENNSKIMDLRRQACLKLVEIQYRTMARAAAIMTAGNGKNIRLHVTMVGHGVFNNPPETVSAAIKALNDELQGVNATVLLCYRHSDKSNIWLEKGNFEKLGISLTPYGSWKSKV